MRRFLWPRVCPLYAACESHPAAQQAPAGELMMFLPLWSHSSHSKLLTKIPGCQYCLQYNKRRKICTCVSLNLSHLKFGVLCVCADLTFIVWLCYKCLPVLVTLLIFKIARKKQTISFNCLLVNRHQLCSQ